MEYRQNEQLKLASEFVQFTNKNIFLTGKAGTGKTTFLHNLKKITPKRMVVVAPTGVAAINAGGVTIHSFFQLSFSPAIPESVRPKDTEFDLERNVRKFGRNKIQLFKCIDLLVIDEISMVRADVLDAVDEVLRRYRNRSKPFGGVQLLMIGDLHQLTPVINNTEWEILQDYYKSIYFFDSFALRDSNPISIELQEIFRQSDAYFIALLNKVRDNKIDEQTIAELNQRFIKNFHPKDDEGYITLTTHNASANEINQARLKEIKTKSHIFSADVVGDFPPFNFPTEQELELRPEAQVMFIKNDPAAEKLYYNGKIGKITRIEKDTVYVKCPNDENEIAVTKVEWENVKYSLNDTTKEIVEEVAGSFTQMPLKLAWAITIHKSQGLTFDKVIIDANAAFAYGQVYVALSRCRTFEGIVLSTPISVSGIKTDSKVLHYSQETRENEPTPAMLSEAKKVFQQDLIFELFDYKLIRYRFDELLKILRENENILDGNVVKEVLRQHNFFEIEILQVADKFKLQLGEINKVAVMPEEHPDLQERIKKAAVYFFEKTTTHLRDFIAKLYIETDNKAVRKLLDDSFEKFQKDVCVKAACLEQAQKGFDTIAYIRKRSDAEVDFRPSLARKEKVYAPVSQSTQHPDLYGTLKAWRDGMAEESNVSAYMILSFKCILELSTHLPTTIKELKLIHGIGETKAQQYGAEIIEIITDYLAEHGIVKEHHLIYETEEKPEPKKRDRKKKDKINTRQVSYDLYKAGKTIAEIAAERSLTRGSIESHLAHYVGLGELEVATFVAKDKIQPILDYITRNPEKTLTEVKVSLGEEVSYSEIRYIMEHKKFLDL